MLRGYKGEARKPVRLGAGTAVPCPYQGKMRPAAGARLSDALTSARCWRPLQKAGATEVKDGRRGVPG